MKPLVALTFDDGPSEWTAPLLDVLATCSAHATFFVLGVNVAGRQDVLRRIVADGHEIAVHGWDHERTRSVTIAELQDRVVRTVEALADYAPHGLRWWRPPWNDATDEQIEAMRQFGLTYCRPTLDGFDVSRSESAIVKDLMRGISAGAIVGLHDGIAPNGQKITDTRWPTIRAAGRVLRHCRSVTLSELVPRKAAAA